MVQSLTLRPIVLPADLEFLFQVYASTRLEELAPLPWDAATRQAFLTMQFNAQHSDYQRNYPAAAFDVIEQAGVAIGRLYVDRRPDELHILDIALLPDYRNRGIGSFFLEQLITEAEADEHMMQIYVERFNPAKRLYTRLGFQIIGDQGVYYLMQRNPDHAG